MKYKKALVTGGAGFIGSHIVDALVNLGIDTISIDNYKTGEHANLEHLSKCGIFKEVECDVCCYEEIIKHMDGVDIIFNEAASIKPVSLEHPQEDLMVNGLGTLNMLTAAREYGVKRFIHASSGSIYGDPTDMAQTEEHAYAPISNYGVSKLCGDRYVCAHAQMYGIDATILRYFHIYGPRQHGGENGGIVPVFIERMLTGEPVHFRQGGAQQRCFTYVEDAVKANIMAMAASGKGGVSYNCAAGKNVTVKQLYNDLCNIIGCEGHPIIYDEWQPGDMNIGEIDNEKIKNEIGVRFEYEYPNGLAQTVQWVKENMRKSNSYPRPKVANT